MSYNDVLVKSWINLHTADEIKQTGTTCFEKRMQWNHNIVQGQRQFLENIGWEDDLRSGISEHLL